MRGIEIRFADSEADNVLAFSLEPGSACAYGEGGGFLDGLNALRQFQDSILK